MNPFPVTSSNLSAPHLALFLQTQYHTAPGVACRLIKSGVNDTYQVTTDTGKYVFRVYSLQWRTREEISEELRLLILLKDQGIPVSWPVADATGNYIQTLQAPEGERFGVLFTYAAGEKLTHYADEIHFKTGAVMARMHQLTQQLPLNRVTYTSKILLEDSLEQVKKFLDADTPEMAFLLSAQQYLLRAYAAADTSKIRQGVVHMDIWFDNMNINHDNQITIFDFDFCGNGWQCLDIAYYILQLHSLIREMPECQAKLDRFLEGYNAVLPISEEEKRLLPMLGVCMYFFYLGIQCQRYDNWSNSFLNEAYLKRFITVLVKRYYELYLPAASTVNP
ncbi:phosphotransferase [Chitinophaga sp. 22321]|uniref:Phosphotransferase n=1 Tax=Chitinophaga hostae TaxID=2831022 RepID=A0ABS5J4C1_9BACT|nr:phosphotransferase [Chitinophaga hostae]MBS0029920.1 phosphotransferase [Chitinophaga hostae]